MKLKSYVWFDSKTDSYGVPMFHDHRGNAIRFFTRLVNDTSREENQIAKFPADFTFFEIGEYDLDLGMFMQYEAKVNLGCALEFKENQEQILK